MSAELARLGSFVRHSDLAQHAARRVTPLSVELSVGTAHNLPPPTQGVASLMILAIFDRIRNGIEAESFDHVHRLVESTKQAFRVRNRHVADPDHMRVAADTLLASDALDQAARAIDPRRAHPWPEPAIKGASVSNVGKPAKMETGLIVNVPAFISEGERIRIDTASGAYVERVK